MATSSLASNTTGTLTSVAGVLNYSVTINGENEGADLLVAAYDANNTLIGWQIVNRSSNLT